MSRYEDLAVWSACVCVCGFSRISELNLTEFIPECAEYWDYPRAHWGYAPLDGRGGTHCVIERERDGRDRGIRSGLRRTVGQQAAFDLICLNGLFLQLTENGILNVGRK